MVCCGCDTSYIVSVHIQCQAPIYTLSLCRGHSWRVRLAKQETLTIPGHIVSPLVRRGPWMFSVVLYCWCHSDSALVLLYFTLISFRFTPFYFVSFCCVFFSVRSFIVFSFIFANFFDSFRGIYHFYSFLFIFMILNFHFSGLFFFFFQFTSACTHKEYCSLCWKRNCSIFFRICGYEFGFGTFCVLK